MARITRKNQKIFGGNSSNNAQFGSARAGTFILDNDPDVIQALPAWGAGINAATVSGEKLPALEEDQGVNYVLTRQLAYIFQEGTPEYNSDTEYHINSIVKEPGTLVLYASISNDNIGNAISDPTKWKRLCDLNTVQSLNNYNATTSPTVNDDETEGYSSGSYWYDTSNNDFYFCVDAGEGAAVWILQSSIDPSDLGTAAYLNVGTSPTNIPQNSNLGAAAYVGIAAGGSANLLRSDGVGSSLTGLNASNISSGTLASERLPQTVGTVGSIAMCVVFGLSGSYGPGATISGSSLRYSNGFGALTGTSPTGIWQCLGMAVTGTGGANSNYSTLWQRVS